VTPPPPLSAFVPVCRNWQTGQLWTLVGLQARAGSIPATGTIVEDADLPLARADIQRSAGGSTPLSSTT
jgi:hypothetical protein